MFVTVEGFGSIWSRRTHDERIAYYNTTGIPVDGKLRHRSELFGQLRFNEIGGFNSKLVERNIGRGFQCTGDMRRTGACLAFHHLLQRPIEPHYFLFTVTSEPTGFLPVGWVAWESGGGLFVFFLPVRTRHGG